MNTDRILGVIALLLAIWFAFMGIVWIYWVALFVAYPAGAISLVIWLFIRKDKFVLIRIIPWVLAAGFTASILVLLGLLLTN